MASRFPVSADKHAALSERMSKVGVREEDLDEQFVTSGGKGGQNVNKVATCVVLLHKPSGVQVKVQDARTQGLNRYLARQRLCERLETAILGAQSAREQEAEKIRRQKRRRSRRAKARMLDDKHAVAKKKALRGPVRGD
ncbi:MAG TPA: peptide chain release factor-like protein [Polyangia bacterium]